MKLEVVKKKSTFNPVKLTIVLESQEELNALVAISGFNVTVADAVQKMPNPEDSFNKIRCQEILARIYQELTGVIEFE